MRDFKEKAKAYALRNALSYKGKANQGAVLSSLFIEGLKKEDIKSFSPTLKKVIEDVNALSLDEQKKAFEKVKSLITERKTREGLAELPDVSKKGVIMRFAPSPSGPLHIGHAITSCLSYLYVKKYGGTFYLRIEDTNPEAIDPSAYDLLKKDADFLFEGKAKIVIQSERMKFYYSYAEKFLNKEKAYVCTCSGDEFRAFSQKKKECPCRNLSKKEQLSRWKQMLAKDGYEEGEAVLRFKSDMKHKNPAMRDFPLARINEVEHPKQRNKYRVWPLMNLAVTTDDIEMKMTHIIRGKDQRDNAERQKMMYEVLGKKYPWAYFIGKIKFKDLELSSRKMREGIQKGTYSGWDDKKLPTIVSLKKQGYKPEAFWRFSELVGLSQADKVMDKKEYFHLLDSFNKKV